MRKYAEHKGSKSLGIDNVNPLPNLNSRLTDDDLNAIRLHERPEGGKEIWVYQEESTLERYARGELTISDKLTVLLGKSFFVQHHRGEKPIDDGLTAKARLKEISKM
jgi:hypothetical protein